MKILLLCAGGMSTSILMKKMEKYAEDNGFELEIVARGVADYEDIYKNFDVILLGPQISYQKQNVIEATNMPVAVISPSDYGIGRVENIFAQVNQLLN